MKAKKIALLGAVASVLLLTGCGSTPFYGVNDQVQINHKRTPDGGSETTCTGTARGVNACPDQTIIDFNSSQHQSRQGGTIQDAEANALKRFCRTQPDNPRCPQGGQ